MLVIGVDSIHGFDNAIRVICHAGSIIVVLKIVEPLGFAMILADYSSR